MNLTDGQIIEAPYHFASVFKHFGVPVPKYVFHDGIYVFEQAMKRKLSRAKSFKADMKFKFADQVRLEFPRGPIHCIETVENRRLKSYIERDIERHPVYNYRVVGVGRVNKHIVLDFLAYRNEPCGQLMT